MLVAPGATPPEVIALLNREVHAIFSDPAVIAELERRGVGPALTGTPGRGAGFRQEGDRALERRGAPRRTRGQPVAPGNCFIMMEGFTRTEIKTSGARIVTVHGGNGPPLLLMHGNPFTHLSWHKFAPRLAQEFTVVATDLRGYGDSSKPPGGDDHSGYSFRAMAQDQVEVMAALGFKKFMAAGHDRGGARAAPHVPRPSRQGRARRDPRHHPAAPPAQQRDAAWGQFSWHWFFNIQPEPMPEKMMGADPDWFIQKKLAKTPQGLKFFGKEALAEYMRCFRNPETIHAICEDYRATFGVDLDMDTKDFDAGRKITCRR